MKSTPTTENTVTDDANSLSLAADLIKRGENGFGWSAKNSFRI